MKIRYVLTIIITITALLMIPILGSYYQILVALIAVLISGYDWRKEIEVDLSEYVYLTYTWEDNEINTDTVEMRMTSDFFDNPSLVNKLVDHEIYSEDQVRKLQPKDELVNWLKHVISGCQVSPNGKLSRGDIIEITIIYNEKQAKKRCLKIINNKLTHQI